jgi:hypothetical protein
VKRTVLLGVVAILAVASDAGAAKFADGTTMRVDIAGGAGEVCAVTEAPGFARCAPSATDPTPEQQKTIAGHGGELLLMAKTPCRGTTCVVTIARAQGTAVDIAGFDRGARESAQKRGMKLSELHTERVQINGRFAIASTMTMEAARTVHAVTYVIGAGTATYIFTFNATDRTGATEVADGTMATFDGAPQKRTVSKAYALGYVVGIVGGTVLLLAVAIGGSIFAVRQSRNRLRERGR